MPGHQGLCGHTAKAVLSPKITPPRLEIQCPRRRTAPHGAASHRPPRNLLPASCVFRLLHRKRKAQIRVYGRTGSPWFTCPPNWHANRKLGFDFHKVKLNLNFKHLGGFNRTENIHRTTLLLCENIEEQVYFPTFVVVGGW